MVLGKALLPRLLFFVSTVVAAWALSSPSLTFPRLPPQTCKAAGAAICNLCPLPDPHPPGRSGALCSVQAARCVPGRPGRWGRGRVEATAVQNGVWSSDASPPAFGLLPWNSESGCGRNGAGARQWLRARHPPCASPPTLVLRHARRRCHLVNALFLA